MAEKTELHIDMPGFVIMSGSQGNGKSYVIKYLMYLNRKKFDWGLVFCNTNFSGKSSFDYIDGRFVHPNYDESKLINLKNIQQKMIENGKEPSAFVIFDDCLFDGQWKSKAFLKLMTQLRHYRVTLIISTQYPYLIPANVRSQASQVIMFRPRGARDIGAQYLSFGQDFDKLLDFKQFINEHTSVKHQFVYHDMNAEGNTIAERYKVMKAPATIPKFTVKFSK